MENQTFLLGYQFGDFGEEKFCQEFSNQKGITCVSVTFTEDGKNFHSFEGRLEGHVVSKPRGQYGSSWE